MEEKVAEVNERIGEAKKKIQLSEGQRKAHFEECDAEKKRNGERIGALKKEVKEMHLALGEGLCCKEAVLRTSGRYPKDVGAIRHKKVEEAIGFIDLKCIDLKKRLDVIKYGNRKRKMRLKRLGEELREVAMRERERRVRKVESVRNKPVCVLENEIHRVEMKMMEAEHVKKKYRSIRVQLLSESVVFESSLRGLEAELMKQKGEMRNLEAINREAMGLRNMTKGTLMRQEMSALSGGKGRECQLQELRHRVEERKAELEKLERRMFPSGRMMFEEGGEGAPGQQGGDGSDGLFGQLESQLAKLRLASGETETEEVLPRFLSQKETKQRLEFLKRITEEEKKELEMRKELSLSELEAVKFAEVKEKEESQEEIERVTLAIEGEKREKEGDEEEVKRTMEQVGCVGRCLWSLLEECEGMNDEGLPEAADGVSGHVNVVNWLARKIRSGIDKIGGGESLRESLGKLEGSQFQEMMSEVSMELGGEEAIVFPGVMPQEEGKQAKAQQPSLLVTEEEDEDEVLSRTYLKRQAQLIVDAKSRKKFSRVLNLPKGKK